MLSSLVLGNSLRRHSEFGSVQAPNRYSDDVMIASSVNANSVVDEPYLTPLPSNQVTFITVIISYIVSVLILSYWSTNLACNYVDPMTSWWLELMEKTVSILKTSMEEVKLAYWNIIWYHTVYTDIQISYRTVYCMLYIYQSEIMDFVIVNS